MQTLFIPAGSSYTIRVDPEGTTIEYSLEGVATDNNTCIVHVWMNYYNSTAEIEKLFGKYGKIVSVIERRVAEDSGELYTIVYAAPRQIGELVVEDLDGFAYQCESGYHKLSVWM